MHHETCSGGASRPSQGCRSIPALLMPSPLLASSTMTVAPHQQDQSLGTTATMGRNEHGELGGICGYVKIKYEERVEAKRQMRSFSEPASVASTHTEFDAKLRKPPMPPVPQHRPRNRLQKRKSVPLALNVPLPVSLFVLAYEPYPYHTLPSEFLGVYSNLNSVTTAALRHGAYAFSREGLIDGSEYLSAQGRIKIRAQPIERTGFRAVISIQNHSEPGEIVRLDIPHPQTQERRTLRHLDRNIVYLAIHENRVSASCIGLFPDKNLAWGACMKSKASCTASGTWVDQSQYFIADNMPQASARLVGSGVEMWFVQVHEIDSVDD